MTITWKSPNDGGSPITGFTVSIRESDGVSFSVDEANCNESTALTCTVPVSTLRAEPYSLEWGSSVYAKIVATNAYGDSVASQAGNGAKILTAASAPTDFVRNKGQRSTTTLGFSWTAPSSLGGAPLIDYRVSMSKDEEPF